MTVPAGRTVQLSPRPATTSSTPSTSRSSCSSATSCPGRTNQFDFNVNDGGRRPDLPRPVRRAVRHRPQHHAVRRPRADAGRLRRLAGRQDRQGQRDAGAAAPSGAAGGPTRPDQRAQGHRVRPDRARAPRPAAPFTIEFENKDAGDAAQRRDPQGLADRRGGLQGRDLHRRRQARRTTSRRSPPGPTRSSAPSIRT